MFQNFTSVFINFEAPSYHILVEGVLFILVLWLLMRKKNHPDGKIELTHEEEEQIIHAWKPQPLVDDDAAYKSEELWGVIESRSGKHVVIDGITYLNMATNNYLGMVDEPLLDFEGVRCVRRYGVGSCGPRGFYGTVDMHIELEEKVAKFLGLEETALYSYGFSTIASAIPSYSKAGDIIFADEKVNFSIQKGLQASRSAVKFFNHNDFTHFEQLLKEQKQLAAANPKKAKTIRQFCVVEGIYSKTGEMCPLQEIVALCKQYKVRIFLDETLSFGAIGNTGRGVTEHLNVSRDDVDLISGSLELAFAAFGGFVVGSSYVVDHQRISGLGYCFSASLPPLLAGVGVKSLEMLENNPKIVQDLQKNCQYIFLALQKLEHLSVLGHELSPIKHLVLKNLEASRDEKQQLLDKIITHVKNEHRIALVKPGCVEKQEINLAEPSIRLTVNRLLTNAEMDEVVSAIEAATNDIFSVELV